MRNVYMSFLGLGARNKETNTFEYSPAKYALNGKISSETPFVQAAEMEILGGENFDPAIIVATRKSYETHYEKSLAPALENVDPIPVIIEEDMTPEGQWKLFETILAYIEHGDRLTLDLTHGFRSTPIIFSAAVNFLQKARNITLDAVYYGVYEKRDAQNVAPIIDMKDFYLINEWADGVSRLVEDADARKLGDAASKSPSFQLGELNDPEIIEAFKELTNTIRNVDVNNVYRKADQTLDLIQKKKEKASETGKLLLDQVIDKFTALTIHGPMSNHYDLAYFQVQIEIIKMLLEHKLYMQAYTVMREFIASVGMVEIRKAKVNNSDGRKYRRRFGEIFVNMVQYEKWNFTNPQNNRDKNELLPYYEKLVNIGVIQTLKNFSKELIQYRNGFDHAWTSKAGADKDIKTKGHTFLNGLEEVIRRLKENQIIA